jgi:ribonuclease HII
MMLTAGVDEAGRGPLAGPVVAAAVILSPDDPISGLADSKTLSAAERETLAVQIRVRARAWAVADADVGEIDQINILHASMLAMRRALLALSLVPEMALIDGNRCPEVPFPARAIIKGDLLEPCISAASILAKVARDAIMVDLDRQYPQYLFAQHKGYPTRAHLRALETWGPCMEHRRSYAPVKSLLRISE